MHHEVGMGWLSDHRGGTSLPGWRRFPSPIHCLSSPNIWDIASLGSTITHSGRDSSLCILHRGLSRVVDGCK